MRIYDEFYALYMQNCNVSTFIQPSFTDTIATQKLRVDAQQYLAES